MLQTETTAFERRSLSTAILIVSEEPTREDVLAGVACGPGLQFLRCDDPRGAAEQIKRKRFSAILCDDVLLDESLRSAIEETTTPMIVVSRLDDWTCYLRAMRAGAFDYVALPCASSEIERILKLAIAEGAPTSAPLRRWVRRREFRRSFRRPA